MLIRVSQRNGRVFIGPSLYATTLRVHVIDASSVYSASLNRHTYHNALCTTLDNTASKTL